MTEPTSVDASSLRDEPFAVEITESTTPFEGAVWDVQSDAFLYNGEKTVRHYIAHPGAAAIVALDGEGRVLLIQQYRHPIKQRDWEIPAGLCDVEGETSEQTARRELGEEADLAAEQWEKLLTMRTSPGGSDEFVDIFLARGLSALEIVHEREAEEADLRWEWVPLADVVDAVMDGRMRNAILVAGVLAAAERIRRG